MSRIKTSLKLRLAPINKEAFTRARDFVRIETPRRLGFVVASAVLILGISWYFSGSVTSVFTIVSIALLFLFVYICEFVRTAYRRDRAMVPLILILVGVLGVVCLTAGTIWLIWDKYRAVARLTDVVAKGKSRRIDIAKSALRLSELKENKAHFDDDVREIESAWRNIEGKVGLPFPIFSRAQPGGPPPSEIIPDLQAWLRVLPASWPDETRTGMAEQVIGHTKNYDPTAKYPVKKNLRMTKIDRDGEKLSISTYMQQKSSIRFVSPCNPK